MARRVEVKNTWLDKAIAWVDPDRGVVRMRNRTTLALAGGYNGARKDKRAFEEWSVTDGDADADIIGDLPELRERCRDLTRNNPLAAGALNTKVTNIVGTGLRVKSRINSDHLGITQEQATTFEGAAEREFKLWAKSIECDLNRKLTFNQMQALALRSVYENGDTFALLPFKERPGGPFGTKVQLVEADRVSNPDYSADTAKIVAGIEKDEDGAPHLAFISNQHPGSKPGVIDDMKWQPVKFFSDTGRPRVLHVFHHLRIGQTRGVPDLAPVIELFKQLGRYTESELMAAVVSGMFTVFVTTEDGEGDLSNLMPGVTEGSSGKDEPYKLGPAAIVGLSENESISTANPGRPNDKFDPFVLAILRQIGVALELPYEILIKHFTASYSASRAALLEAWRMFKTRRQWFAAAFCQPIYEAVITEAISRGRIAAPGFLTDETIRAMYLNTIWTGDAPGQLDPLKESNAARGRIEGNLSTEERETMEITGADWELDQRQRTRERQRHKQDGTTQQPATAGFLMPEQKEETEDDSDEGDEKEKAEQEENSNAQ